LVAQKIKLHEIDRASGKLYLRLPGRQGRERTLIGNEAIEAASRGKFHEKSERTIYPSSAEGTRTPYNQPRGIRESIERTVECLDHVPDHLAQ